MRRTFRPWKRAGSWIAITAIRPDPEGRFYQRVSFEANCQACHALQFDKNNPQLHIPHGDVNLVRKFLRTLPAQYGDYARLKQGKNQRQRSSNLRRATDQAIAGAIWQRRVIWRRAVFFDDEILTSRSAGEPAATRANFAGCALLP